MIEVNRTLDVGYCLSIITNSEIFNAISEDGMTIEKLKVDVIHDYWCEFIDGDIDIGVFQLKQMFNKTWDAHIHILPEHRKKYTQQAGGVMWKWIEDNLSGHLIYTTVPVFCPNVVRFLKGFDFKDSGILKNAWFKNGKQHDMTILTREVI